MQPTFYTEIFNQYFKNKFWGNQDGSSGPNSAFSETPKLRKNLENLFTELTIKTLFDAGCGDANLFKYLSLTHENFKNIKIYTGAECVESLTQQNQKNFAHLSNFNFVTQDLLKDPIPTVDLILCRDVIHYWPNQSISHFLKHCLESKSRYLLITHNIHSAISANSPTEFGIFRPVNLTQRPFFWPQPISTLSEDIFGKELALFELNKQYKSHR